jgi:hypothetical protein
MPICRLLHGHFSLGKQPHLAIFGRQYFKIELNFFSNNQPNLPNHQRQHL